MRTLSVLGALATLVACGAGSPSARPQSITPLPGDPDFVRDPALDVANVSKHGETRSHNLGSNCMECHQAHGPGRGRFTVAGTLYDEKTRAPSPNGVVELRTSLAPTGTVVLSIQVDALGNFFSTEPLPLPQTPLFPSLRNADGSKRNAMRFPTINGACNQCHVRGNLVDVKE
jgi:hypothetical protein